MTKISKLTQIHGTICYL